MEQIYQPPNPRIMDAIQLRTNLLQRIEQADEKLLRVINSVVETVVAEYVQPVAEDELSDEAFAELPAPDLKRMTKEESNTELKEAIVQCERGEVLTLDELDKEMATW